MRTAEPHPLQPECRRGIAVVIRNLVISSEEYKNGYGSILSGDTPSYRNVNTFGFQDILDWLHSRDPSRSAVEVKSNHSGDVNPFLNLPTCSYMANVTGDSLLWHQLLLRDIPAWPVIGHLSHPQVYQDAASDLHPKLVYSQCYRNRNCVPANSFTSPITSKVKWFLRRLHGHVPKVLLFGSGLEYLPFVHMLMWEDASPYKPVGLFPGKDGVGSGFCVEYCNGSPANLVTLYTSNKAERQRDSSASKRTNRLVVESTVAGTQLTNAVSDLCRQADAFMLVIDASCGPNDEVDRHVLDAMLQSGREHTPVLVVNAMLSTGSMDIHMPLLVADKLGLCKLANHPWQVRSVELQTFCGLQEGLLWLLRSNW